MRGYMFRNRWGALLFVVMTAAGAASLVGGEDDTGVLLDTAEDLQRQKAAMNEAMSDPAPAAAIAPATEAIEFTSDEELIDDASGFDPTPPDPEVVPEGEVVIVNRDGGES